MWPIDQELMSLCSVRQLDVQAHSLDITQHVTGTETVFRPNQMIQRKHKFSHSFKRGSSILVAAVWAAAAVQKAKKNRQKKSWNQLNFGRNAALHHTVQCLMLTPKQGGICCLIVFSLWYDLVGDRNANLLISGQEIFHYIDWNLFYWIWLTFVFFL